MDHALDAIQPLSKGHLDMIRRDVDLVVEDALKHRDPEIAFTYGQKLNETGQAVWVAVAHLVYKMKQHWKKEFPSDDEFTTVASARWNKSPETIRRYLEIWEWIFERQSHPDIRSDRLLSQPMAGLWYVKAAAKEGQLVDADWEEISRAPDVASLREIGRRVRGEVGRAKDALKLAMEEDGTIKARKAGAYKTVGFLNLGSEDPVVIAAIEAIERRAGIFRK